jgi:hypothetical protein
LKRPKNKKKEEKYLLSSLLYDSVDIYLQKTFGLPAAFCNIPPQAAAPDLHESSFSASDLPV